MLFGWSFQAFGFMWAAGFAFFSSFFRAASIPKGLWALYEVMFRLGFGQCVYGVLRICW